MYRLYLHTVHTTLTWHVAVPLRGPAARRELATCYVLCTWTFKITIFRRASLVPSSHCTRQDLENGPQASGLSSAPFSSAPRYKVNLLPSDLPLVAVSKAVLDAILLCNLPLYSRVSSASHLPTIYYLLLTAYLLLTYLRTFTAGQDGSVGVHPTSATRAISSRRDTMAPAQGNHSGGGGGEGGGTGTPTGTGGKGLDHHGVASQYPWGAKNSLRRVADRNKLRGHEEATPLLAGGRDDDHSGYGDARERGRAAHEWEGQADYEGLTWWHRPSVGHVTVLPFQSSPRLSRVVEAAAEMLMLSM